MKAYTSDSYVSHLRHSSNLARDKQKFERFEKHAKDEFYKFSDSLLVRRVTYGLSIKRIIYRLHEDLPRLIYFVCQEVEKIEKIAVNVVFWRNGEKTSAQN